ncbi:hypothetical protein GCM10022252_78250 [Streptosporangium oxazolinicum]|uniref:Arsenate reductase n=1 Tax=Streptosporangium oxazolinicum TaxID=909287 RepID=A0ABP8BMK9_9ACTN
MEWAPAECVLPTGERPLRTAEFDALFASALSGLERVSPTHLRLNLRGDAQVEETARDLVARETVCCSFFAFTFTRERDDLVLDVEVPAVHSGVLDGLVVRALAMAPGVSS